MSMRKFHRTCFCNICHHKYGAYCTKNGRNCPCCCIVATRTITTSSAHIVLSASRTSLYSESSFGTDRLVAPESYTITWVLHTGREIRTYGLKQEDRA